MHDAIHAVVTHRAAWITVLAACIAGLTLNCAPSSNAPAPAATGASSSASAPAGGASPTLAGLEAQIRRFAPVDITADVSALPDSERQSLAEMLRRRASDRRTVPRAGLGRQHDGADSAGGRPHAGGPGAAALLPDQQRPMVAPRQERVVPRSRRRRAREAGTGQLLPGRRDARRGRQVDRRTQRPGARGSGRLLQRDSPRRGRPSAGRALQRARTATRC